MTTDCTDGTDGAIFDLLSVLFPKSVVPTAVFSFDSHEIAGFDQFCLAPLSSLRNI